MVIINNINRKIITNSNSSSIMIKREDIKIHNINLLHRGELKISINKKDSLVVQEDINSNNSSNKIQVIEELSTRVLMISLKIISIKRAAKSK